MFLTKFKEQLFYASLHKTSLVRANEEGEEEEEQAGGGEEEEVTKFSLLY